MLKDKLSVVIVCFDPYIDAISLNPKYFTKNWAHCSLDVFYITSNVDVETNHNVIKTNGDLSYCGRMNEALKHIKTEYILLLLDDYFIDKPIDENKLSEEISFMDCQNVQFCELYTMFSIPKGRVIKHSNNRYINISLKRKYRITLQPAIFKKVLLKKLLLFEPADAWAAELTFMKKDFQEIDAYYSLNKSFSVINYIDKGLVTRKAYRQLKKDNLWNKQRLVTPVLKAIKKNVIRKLGQFVPQKVKDKIKKSDIIFKG